MTSNETVFPKYSEQASWSLSPHLWWRHFRWSPLLSWKCMHFRQKVFHSSATPCYSNVTSVGLQSTLSLRCEIVQRKGPPWHWDTKSLTHTQKSHTWISTAFWEILIKRGKCKKQTHKKQISKSQEIRKAGESFLSEIFLSPLATIQPMKSNGLLKHLSNFLFPHNGVLSIFVGNLQVPRVADLKLQFFS